MLRRGFSTSAEAAKSVSSKPRAHKSQVSTRFPTKYNPVRSAFKQEILLPEGVLYNPAPSAPTPAETPAAFLPPNDIRSFRKDEHDYPVEKMPPLKERSPTSHQLNAAQCEKIQQLRFSEPTKWTRKALAAKFNVSEYVIGLVSEPHPDYKAEMDRRLTEIKSMWNDRRSRARLHRQWRKDMWLRDA